MSIVYNSQIAQDLWVLNSTNYKKNGYFVDIGANDPIKYNNTYLLENKYNWTGICVEPTTSCYNKLKQIRNKNTIIDNRVLYSVDNVDIFFKECEVSNLLNGIINTFDTLHTKNREKGSVKKKSTLSLNSLLQKYNAPLNIDYISIDTEGSEYDILKTFDFNKYNVFLFTVEHNSNSENIVDIQKQKNIEELMIKNNYKKVDHINFSKQFKKNYSKKNNFEDWYIKIKN